MSPCPSPTFITVVSPTPSQHFPHLCSDHPHLTKDQTSLPVQRIFWNNSSICSREGILYLSYLYLLQHHICFQNCSPAISSNTCKQRDKKRRFEGNIMMRRKQERLEQGLQVKVPSPFRCPISLDVMRSPVSLCTGVTYDRASIQRWLESGNTTCPATMLPLPSTDLVPNLTLQRLIHVWSSSAASAAASPTPLVSRRIAGGIIRELRSASSSTSDDDLVPQLRKLADFFSADNVDDTDKNDLVNAGGCASVLVSLLLGRDFKLESLVEVARILAFILTSDFVEESNKKIAVSHLCTDLDRSVSALIRVLRDGNGLESRIDAAIVLDAIIAASDAGTKVLIAEEVLIRELVRLIEPSDEKGAAMDRRAVEAGLGCLARISAAKRARPRVVRAGVVPALARVLMANAAVAPAATAEKALRVMEAAAGCAEGRAAICEDGAAAATAVVARMVKAGREGAESAVAVLWSVCQAFRDRRAVEAVAAAEGGATKMLLLMQSGCSPAARQMAADLLKIYRVNSKSRLAGYDTKTTHITPF
ncbi:U-box domain-containing protein 27-like [Musa acuminata AAA Group]|uniref:U-box domain-containing protein 27-like n=1 Tax=Musa acuminata AAA Group TaxID=214697 RepID=UPI0031E137D5